MEYELAIQNGGTIYLPDVEDPVTWKTYRKGQPGQLEFSVLKGENLSFGEGNPVSFKVDGKPVFYGFVFKKSRTRDGIISVTAYDQLRYLKNKDTVVETGKKASELLALLAGSFGLNLGTVEDTGHIIPSIVEENETLFDMIQNALDETVTATGKLYCLFDDFGKLSLRDVSSMKTSILIEDDTAEDFDYTSTIDGETYNKIKLTYDNDETGKREVYIAQNSKHMNDWGVLQYYESLQNSLGAAEKADALLKYYDLKTRSLTVNGVFGDLSARAGTSVGVHLNLGDIITQNYMMIESATHTFDNAGHRMDLQLIGGSFLA